jgi:hypothetical protein
MRSINENKTYTKNPERENSPVRPCFTGCKDRESGGDYDRMAGNKVSSEY